MHREFLIFSMWSSRTLAAVLGWIFLTGCSAPRIPKDQFATLTRSAWVFKNGPSQGPRADFQLPEGQAVMIRGRGFGYTLVETPGGLSGYLLSDSLQVQKDRGVIGSNWNLKKAGSSPKTPLPSPSLPVLPARGDADLFNPKDFGVTNAGLPEAQ